MKRAGFTMVEVLVAIAITGGLMVAVLTNLDATRRAVDTIHNIMETENTGPRILDLLRSDLDRIAIYDAHEYKVLKGESDTVQGADADRLDLIVSGRTRAAFEMPGRDEAAHAPLAEVGYRLRSNPDRPEFMELYRREDPLVDEDPWRDGAFALLYDRTVAFNLRYVKKPDHNLLFEDAWDSEQEQSLPFAIEFFLEIEVQPRQSRESLGILGANRARLDFSDLILVPSHQRWVFRNRLHPIAPTLGGAEGQAGAGETPDPTAGEGGETPR